MDVYGIEFEIENDFRNWNKKNNQKFILKNDF